MWIALKRLIVDTLLSYKLREMVDYKKPLLISDSTAERQDARLSHDARRIYVVWNFGSSTVSEKKILIYLTRLQKSFIRTKWDQWPIIRPWRIQKCGHLDFYHDNVAPTIPHPTWRWYWSVVWSPTQCKFGQLLQYIQYPEAVFASTHLKQKPCPGISFPHLFYKSIKSARFATESSALTEIHLRL